MKHPVIGQCEIAPNFSAFHWSPHSSLLSIGQNFVNTRVVHLPKRTETSLITELDQSGPNHHLLQLCTARTACSDSDQAVRAVHSCISWFISISTTGIYKNQVILYVYHCLLTSVLRLCKVNIFGFVLYYTSLPLRA